MVSGPALGPLGIVPEKFDHVWFQQLVDRLEQIHLLLSQPAETGYTVTNGTTNRDLDVTGDTLAETKETLGTLIDDMVNKGMLG